ncbi:MAG: MFS transporter, partial [Candidatus Lokiarchaeota archaeon]|nr:MFS transporter [Candidatus Lokiarchaeota archaeon]MBD3342179.1 MFS transporter [Candidatus Lokiarchaeota archaeon]
LAMILVPFLMLLVNDSIQVPEVKLKLHLKRMFNNSRDWKAYMYSMSRAFLDGVILLLISIYTLIELGLIQTEGVTLSIEGSNLNVYLYQAYVSLIISVGIIIGAIVGGQVADRHSRRLSVVLSVIITVVSLFLLLIDYSIVLVLLFIASLTGASLGWRRSSASAIISEISKEHPEMDSTYFSIAMAFANIGASLGLSLTGIVLNFTQDYRATFLFLALLSLLVLIPLFLMDPKDYEYKISSEA